MVALLSCFKIQLECRYCIFPLPFSLLGLSFLLFFCYFLRNLPINSFGGGPLLGTKQSKHAEKRSDFWIEGIGYADSSRLCVLGWR